MLGNYILRRKDNKIPILAGDIDDLDKFVKSLCKLNPTQCKKKDYEIVVATTENSPNMIPVIIQGFIFMTERKKP